ncbi:type II toxin-antitoxin system VapC family toxin [Cellulosimicrobium composti]|uniref:type II toxin-antitoxin system VapC family toxin n=1 Tax=Cellulosimicrobium composti TaxID=2672572 RepID=UPI0037BAF317
MIVLDTNVVSELTRTTPERSVVRWLDGVPPRDVWLTSITIAEMSYGIARLVAGRRRDELVVRVETVLAGLGDQVLSFDKEAAHAFGAVMAGRDRAGQPIGTADAQIAAICRVHDATLATRNVRDFVGTGVAVVDPWGTGPS